ncbi:uncharacterized protein LOC131220104 [Magnolia sinica]|uniref:uncharacterized protein LOC131220104 n=1 Tax=Magnolia sinica TaxID=86752 RepID=UPI002658BE78|nr:uncharacterized protein LOC131220104 [Magnolia sinica]
MNSLKVLDICGIDISMLPPSVEGLKNLRTLWLDRCPQLKDVTLIGGLKNLEILCLQETGICELTEKMGELHNLKLLDLMETDSLEMIAPNVISRMTQLEELRMGISFSKWEVMGNGDARQASLAEVASLSRLTVLYIHVENVECLSQNIPGPWKNLKKFRICVGRDYTDSKAARSIKIENSPCPNAKWVEVLFNRTNELELVHCKGLYNLMMSHELSFNSLKILLIKECGEMEHLLSVEEGEEPPRNVFEHLNKLSLEELMNLKTFCRGPLPAGSLQNLRKLNISRCNKLINIMPSDLLQSMEELDVSHCHELVEVFHFQGTSKEDALLSKLRKLKLYDLPELTSIWKGAIPPLGSHHHLEFVSVRYCRRLRYLVSPALAERLQLLKDLHIVGEILLQLKQYLKSKIRHRVGYPSPEVDGVNALLNLYFLVRVLQALKKLDLSGLPELTSIWKGSVPPLGSLHHLEEVRVVHCKRLRYLLSLALAERLQQLKLLHIWECEKMETLIGVEVEESTSASLLSSSGSSQSELTCLPHSLPHGRMFPNLQTLHISKCNGLQNLFSLSVAQGLLQLECLSIIDCKGMEVIIAKEADDEVVDQEGYSVDEDEMTKYGIGEGLFKDVNMLEEASCRVHMLFDKFKASCLLLEGDISNSVKLHDVVRDVALSIALRAEHGFLVKAKLLTLFLFENHSLKEIPDDFFQGMNSLKVLDISGIDISMLLPSVEGLKNLRTLWLDRCPQLKDVTLIGGLKKLEILCLQKTGICELTEKMGELQNLKLLDLMKTNSLETIASNFISRMTQLEELRMGNSFGKWEVMGNGDAR